MLKKQNISSYLVLVKLLKHHLHFEQAKLHELAKPVSSSIKHHSHQDESLHFMKNTKILYLLQKLLKIKVAYLKLLNNVF